MKKIFKIVLMIFPFVILSDSVSAQMKEYTWNEYNMKFSIPNSLNIEENNSNKFSAAYENIRLIILPETGNALKYNELSGQLSDWACLNGAAFSIINPNPNEGYWGVYTQGTDKNGLPVFVALYVHPDYPSKYFYVWIDYKEDLVDTASEIITSFQPL